MRIIWATSTILGSEQVMRSKTMARSLCLRAPQAQVGKVDSQIATPEQIPWLQAAVVSKDGARSYVSNYDVGWRRFPTCKSFIVIE